MTCPICHRKAQVKDCGEDPLSGFTWRTYHCPSHPKQEFEPTYEIPQKAFADLANHHREAYLFTKNLFAIPLYRK